MSKDIAKNLFKNSATKWEEDVFHKYTDILYSEIGKQSIEHNEAESSVDRPPSWYYKNSPNKITYEVKKISVMNLSTKAVGSLVILRTEVPFKDLSEGHITQYAIDKEGNEFRRTGLNNFGEWEEIDYVIEKGENYNGWYEKWRSGKLVQWGISGLVKLSFPKTASWGQLFTSGQNSIPPQKFPIPFKETPVITRSFIKESGANYFLMDSSMRASNTQTGSWELVRGTYAGEITGRITWIAYGRWK